MKKLAAIVLLVCISFIAIDPLQRVLLSRHVQIFTLEDIYRQGITNFIGEQIYLKTRFGHNFFKKLPVSRLERAERYTNALALNLEKEDILSRAGFDLVSNDIQQYNIIPSWITKRTSIFYIIYTYKNKIFWNTWEEHIVEGKIKYRDWLNMNEEKANDPAIIIQNNNPLYWNQSFEFEVDNIY